MQVDRTGGPGICLRFEQRSGHLFVAVTGERGSAQDGLEAFQRIAAQCARLHPRRVLIADLLHGPADTPQALAALMRSLGTTLLATLRIAYYVREVKNVPAFQHAELEGMELGMHMRLFTSQRDAQVWLACDPAP